MTHPRPIILLLLSVLELDQLINQDCRPPTEYSPQRNCRCPPRLFSECERRPSRALLHTEQPSNSLCSAVGVPTAWWGPTMVLVREQAQGLYHRRDGYRYCSRSAQQIRKTSHAARSGRIHVLCQPSDALFVYGLAFGVQRRSGPGMGGQKGYEVPFPQAAAIRAVQQFSKSLSANHSWPVCPSTVAHHTRKRLYSPYIPAHIALCQKYGRHIDDGRALSRLPDQGCCFTNSRSGRHGPNRQ